MDNTVSVNTDNLLLVGYVAGSFGVRGQIKLKAVTDQPEHLEQHVQVVYILPQSRRASRRSDIQSYPVVKIWQHKPGMLVLSLKGITTRDAADELRQAEVYIHEQDACPLESDEYYIHQLYNLHVETVDGVEIGQVSDVLETGANMVVVVTRPEQPDVLLPMIRDVVKELDVKGGRMVVELMEGLVE